MLSPVMQEAINDQINNELFSSYIYLSMSAWCEYHQFTGSAQWLRVQSQEEQTHAMRLKDFLLARHCPVTFRAIEQPETEFETLVEVFEKALAQEQQVTGQIDKLYELAFQDKAFAAMVELEWFITEQVEEEKSVRGIVHKLKMVQHDPASLFGMDNELGQRSTPPEAVA